MKEHAATVRRFWKDTEARRWDSLADRLR